MKTFLIPFLCAPLAFGCASAIASSTEAASSSSACEIRMTEMSGGLRIEGIVYGTPGSTGNYRLELSKSGPSGVSDVRQGGDFMIDPSGETVVSVTEVGADTRGSYQAAMSVDGTAGPAHCDL
ncbi:MAG: curli-like amyloid fiber formation chaperone CsgH [Parvibaculum sp.]